MKKLLVAAILVATAVVGWRWRHTTHVVEPTVARDVFNRFWVDHLPATEREEFNVFVIHTPESIGAFAQESQWHGQIERFRFEASGDMIRAVFPWSGDREQLTVKATRCEEADMDYCLEITGSKHGVSHYYSRIGWERKGAEDIEQFRARLLATH